MCFDLASENKAPCENKHAKEKDLCKIQSKICAKIAVLNNSVQQHSEILLNSPPVSNPLNKGINFTVKPAMLSKPCTLTRKYSVHNSTCSMGKKEG